MGRQHALSTAAIIGDSVFRSANGNKLILQSGAGGAALYIDQYNNVVLDNPSTCLSSLNISGVTTLLNNATCMNNLNIVGSLNVSNTTILNNNATCGSTLNLVGLLTLGNNSGLYLNNTNNTSNSLLAIAQTVIQYSNSSTTGDTILKCGVSNNLILQSGTGTSAITINQSNDILLNNTTTCLLRM